MNNTIIKNTKKAGLAGFLLAMPFTTNLNPLRYDSLEKKTQAVSEYNYSIYSKNEIIEAARKLAPKTISHQTLEGFNPNRVYTDSGFNPTYDPKDEKMHRIIKYGISQYTKDSCKRYR